VIPTRVAHLRDEVRLNARGVAVAASGSGGDCGTYNPHLLSPATNRAKPAIYKHERPSRGPTQAGVGCSTSCAGRNVQLRRCVSCVSFAICFVGLRLGAYIYAAWTLGLP
jgi:hypothetical protein